MRNYAEKSIGKKYYKLTVTKVVGIDRFGRKIVSCECSCGNNIESLFYSISNNKTKSCGCLNRENITKRNFIHGQRRSKTYRSWAGMLQRCLNKDNPDYCDYGARGISVCERWMKFENFFEDMGERPLRKSLDRIDNNGPYDPQNCKWSTNKEQATNRRTTRLFMIGNETKCLKHWSIQYGINYKTVLSRLNKGVDILDALGVSN